MTTARTPTALLALVVACSAPSPIGTVDASSEGASDATPLCPDDLPQSCPSPVPSYKTDVEPIFALHCTVCHSPSGVAGHSQTTYLDVYSQRSGILDQVYSCEMPPLGYPTLTTAERLTLLDWLVCNAPNN